MTEQKKTQPRRVAKYKLIRGADLTEMEVRVNYFLAQPVNSEYTVHGDIQMYSYSEYVQTLVGSELTND